jgi:large conductance mechanosensitive channel
MWNEFKAFVMRGNVMDLAVGVIIGASFGAIVKSLVDDILMPPIGLVTGGLDFSNLMVVLKDGAKAPPPYATPAAAHEAGAVTLNYGAFLNNVLTFIIIAIAIFMVIKAVNRLQRQPAPPTPDSRPCPYCTMTVSLAATRCPHCTSELSGRLTAGA